MTPTQSPTVPQGSEPVVYTQAEKVYNHYFENPLVDTIAKMQLAEGFFVSLEFVCVTCAVYFACKSIAAQDQQSESNLTDGMNDNLFNHVYASSIGVLSFIGARLCAVKAQECEIKLKSTTPGFDVIAETCRTKGKYTKQGIK